MRALTKNLVRTGLLGTVLAASSASWATPVIYFGEDLGLGDNIALFSYPNANAANSSFLASLYGVGTETFESYADTTQSPLALNFSGAGTATLSGSGIVASVAPGSTFGGRYAISGRQYWDVGSIFNITFSKPIAAFGFYGTDIGDFGGRVKITTNGSGGPNSYIVNNTINGKSGGVLFWGIIDVASPFTSISFGNTRGIDAFGFDNMTIGAVAQVVVNPVPEPGSLALLGVSLAGLAAVRRRKQA